MANMNCKSMQARSSSPEPPPYEESYSPKLPTSSPPATANTFYADFSKVKHSIKFAFHPDPKKPLQEQPWYGEMSVKTKNVPLLMREGITIGAENIIRHEGYIEGTKTPPEPWMKAQWSWTRHYYLKDSQEPPRWVAHMECLSATIENLANLRLCDLSYHDVNRCEALSVEGKLVYSFRGGRSSGNINCIYDDLPLEGLWPWPRRREGEEEEEGP